MFILELSKLPVLWVEIQQINPIPENSIHLTEEVFRETNLIRT